MKYARSFSIAALLVLLSLPAQSVAQELPYTEGAVWGVHLMTAKTGMTNDYLRSLAATSRAQWEEMKKQGLILSYKILLGSAANKDDWDVMIIYEYKNMAALDGADEKWEAIAAKIIGSQEQVRAFYLKRSEMRDYFGHKILREIILK